MCQGGRIRRHLARLVDRPETDVVFLGYQASGTLGRSLVEGAPEVEIDGRTIPVRCRVHTLGGFSGHAGRSELLDWARRAGRPGTRAFVVHGESRARRGLAEGLEGLEMKVGLPGYRERVELA